MIGRNWDPGDAFRRCYTGKLRGYLTTLHACYRRVRAAGGWHGTPRARSLALIGDYQANVSAGRNLCPRTGPSCSARGHAAVTRFGAAGWILVPFILTSCHECNDPTDPFGRTGCC